MDKLDEKNTEKRIEKTKKRDLFSKIKVNLLSAKAEKGAFACDLILFSLGFVLSRCHLLFGARPAGLALVAMLPVGVWQATIGALLGGLTLGINGIIFAATTLVTLLLRAAVTSGDRDSNGKMLLFGENLLTRMAISILGGFITAVYEVMLSGLNEKTLLFGLTMIIVTPIFTFGLSGLFSTGISLASLLNGPKDLLSLNDADKKERYDKIFFQLSALLLIFLILFRVLQRLLWLDALAHFEEERSDFYQASQFQHRCRCRSHLWDCARAR